MGFETRYNIKISREDIQSTVLTNDIGNVKCDVVSYSETQEDIIKIQNEIDQTLISMEEAEDAIEIMARQDHIYAEDEEDDTYRDDRARVVASTASASLREAQLALANSLGKLGLSREDIGINGSDVKYGLANIYNWIKEFIKKVIDMLKDVMSHANTLIQKLWLKFKMLLAQRRSILDAFIKFCKANKNVEIKGFDEDTRKYINRMFHVYINSTSSGSEKTLDMMYILDNIKTPNYSILLELAEIFSNARNKHFLETDDSKAIDQRLKSLAGKDNHNKAIIDYISKNMAVKDELIYAVYISGNSVKCFSKVGENEKSEYRVNRYNIKVESYDKEVKLKNVRTLGDLAGVVEELARTTRDVYKHYDKLTEIQNTILKHIKDMDKDIKSELNNVNKPGDVKRILNANVRAARSLSTELIYDLVVNYINNTNKLLKVISKILKPYQLDRVIEKDEN